MPALAQIQPSCVSTIRTPPRGADDRAALAEDQLDQPRVLAELGRRARARARRARPRRGGGPGPRPWRRSSARSTTTSSLGERDPVARPPAISAPSAVALADLGRARRSAIASTAPALIRPPARRGRVDQRRRRRGARSGAAASVVASAARSSGVSRSSASECELLDRDLVVRRAAARSAWRSRLPGAEGRIDRVGRAEHQGVGAGAVAVGDHDDPASGSCARAPRRARPGRAAGSRRAAARPHSAPSARARMIPSVAASRVARVVGVLEHLERRRRPLRVAQREPLRAASPVTTITRSIASAALTAASTSASIAVDERRALGAVERARAAAAWRRRSA